MVHVHAALTQVAEPLCSICIANFNGVALLDDCLKSIELQSSEIGIEIIVHDDASTDDSVSFLRSRYPNVEVIASDRNVGFCTANNRMAAMARGKFLLLLNNDAALLPDAIACLVTAGAREPHAILTLPQFDARTGELVDRGSLLDPFYNPVPNLDPRAREVAYVIGACLWISRSQWDRLGGFPEWIESIGEDLFLCCAARLSGAPIRCLPCSGYRHWQGKSFSGDRPVAGLHSRVRRRRLSERNKFLVMLVSTPTPLVYLLACVHLLLLSLEGLCLVLLLREIRKPLSIYGYAITEPFRLAPIWSRERRRLQAGRQIGLLAFVRPFRVRLQKLHLLRRHGVPTIT